MTTRLDQIRNPIYRHNSSLPALIGLGLVMVVALIATLALEDAKRQIHPSLISNSAGDTDFLAYVSDEDNLMLVNPRTREQTKLLEGVNHFALSPTGIVAYTLLRDESAILYQWDSTNPQQAAIIIAGPTPGTAYYPREWSPNGRFLSFSHHGPEQNQKALYVWDGSAATDITPPDELGEILNYYDAWSYDGRLAIVVDYSYLMEPEVPPEIYLWDGTATVNLSQDPDSWDSSISWSRDGQLMFNSDRAGDYLPYVWDGLSYKDGMPDANAIVPVLPELQIEGAGWINGGRLALEFPPTPFGSRGKNQEIGLWDPQTEQIVERYAVASDNYYSYLDRGGKVIISTHLASGIPSFYFDVENTSGQVLFQNHVGEAVWSESGYLAYCGIDDRRSRNLTIWDGARSWVVAQVSYRPVQWQSHPYQISCNNG